MTVFVDAHVLLWAIYLPERLSEQVRSAITQSSTQRLVSEATLWELLNKAARGKLPFPDAQVSRLLHHIEQLRVSFVAVRQSDILSAAILPHHHHDPFDRMLIAQARSRSLPIFTSDSMFASYDVQVIW